MTANLTAVDHGRPGDQGPPSIPVAERERAKIPQQPVDHQLHAQMAARLAVLTTRLEQTNLRLAFAGLPEDARLIERNAELIRETRGRFGS